MDGDLYFIPIADRAPGEPGVRGCPRDVAEEREAELTAPEILAAYRAKLPELPRLAAQRERSRNSGGLIFGSDFKAWVIAELRAPLNEYFGAQLRAGKWQCFGFSENDDLRVPIRSPWRDSLVFDGLTATDDRGRAYSDVLFYQMISGSSARRVGAEAGPEPVTRRNWTENQIRDAARTLYGEMAENPPNIERAETLIRERLPGAVRCRIRTVLAEPEFGNQRRRPGERRNP